MVIKKIFDKNFDDEVHADFLKFSRGEFKGKYMIEGKKQKDKYSIKTSPEFANFFVKKVLEEIEGVVHIKGKIISTMDLSEEVSFDIKKKENFQGIRNIEIDSEIEASEILGLLEKYPKAFFGLTFKSDKSVLKIKPKAPKSPKPSSKGDEGPKVDFCSLKTTNEGIVNEIFFDVSGFTEIKIGHVIKINEIVYPDNVKELKPEEIREKSKRKGILIREIEVDGKSKVFEAEFVA